MAASFCSVRAARAKQRFPNALQITLAREAEIPRQRAESYLGILEDLLLGFRLQVFQRRTQHLRALCQLLSFCPEPLLIDGIRCEPLEGWLRELRA